MTGLLDSLALLCTAAGLVAGITVLASSRDSLLALRTALELWVAAGLLRLAGPPSWSTLAAAAAVIVTRQLITQALRWSGPGG
ncbi:hypothetical protein BH18ACT8_BH18ACT8_16340 [soil metagenome]